MCPREILFQALGILNKELDKTRGKGVGEVYLWKVGKKQALQAESRL